MHSHTRVKKNKILLLAIIFGLLMLIAILCINNSAALAASFGFAPPAKSDVVKSKPLQTQKAADKLSFPSIPLHTYQRSHVADQPSDALDESDTETSPAETESSHVTMLPIHGTVSAAPPAPRRTGPKTPVLSTGKKTMPVKKAQGQIKKPAAKQPEKQQPASGEKKADTPAQIPPHIEYIRSVNLNHSELNLKKGETAQLTAAVLPADTTQSKRIAWSSSNPSAATVDKAGKVTAIEGGKAIITATSVNGKTASCAVTVSVPATAIKLDITDTKIEKGDSRILTAKVEPADTTNGITWSSSNPTAATVDKSGKVTAVGAGTAVITAKAGNQTAQCEITVGISITKIVLNEDKVTLIKGSTTVFTGVISPADTTEDKTITWASSNPAAATVDESGKVTAVEGGKAIITAKAGKITAQCEVTVLVPVTGISVQSSITLGKGKTAVLAEKITPDDATDKAVTWSSDNPAAATVDENGKVTAVGAGRANITVTAHDGGFKASCCANIVIYVHNIKLSEQSAALTKGGSKQLSVSINPADTTEDKTVTWSSDNPAAATVDGTGKITAVEGGKANITAKVGKFTAQCKVIVTVPVTGIALDRSSIILAPNEKAVLKADIQPTDATDKAVVWSSDHPDVIAIDQQGNIQAVAATGQANITATAHDGGYTASCMVRIQAVPSAPQNLKAEMINDTQVKITWDVPASSGTSPITEYTVTVNEVLHTVNAGIGNSLTIDCPSNIPTFTISICAANNSGDGAKSTRNYNVSHTTQKKDIQKNVWKVDYSGYCYEEDPSTHFRGYRWENEKCYVDRYDGETAEDGKNRFLKNGPLTVRNITCESAVQTVSETVPVYTLS